MKRPRILCLSCGGVESISPIEPSPSRNPVEDADEQLSVSSTSSYEYHDAIALVILLTLLVLCILLLTFILKKW